MGQVDGGELLVRVLERAGIDTVFTLHGGHLDAIYHAARERDEKARAADPTRVPYPFYVGDDVAIKASSLSPTGRWMLLLVLPKERDDGEHDVMPNYVSDDGYVDPKEVRTLVGTGKMTRTKPKTPVKSPSHARYMSARAALGAAAMPASCGATTASIWSSTCSPTTTKTAGSLKSRSTRPSSARLHASATKRGSTGA